jgi:hypothetical protein
MTCRPSLIAALLVFIISISEVLSCSNRGDLERNLIFTAQAWYPAVDSYGSTYRTDGELVSDGVATVSFTIAQMDGTEEWTPWVELVCELGYTLEDYSGLEITYKNDTDLLVKLSQSDFGADGNETYSHYEYRLPSANEWQTHRIQFSTFLQPDWTPEISRIIPLYLENVNAVYLVPDLDPIAGESSTLQVRHLELF